MPVPNIRTDDVMCDLETVGRRAGCGIISIGAVEFNPHTGQLGREFYMPVNIASCEDVGLFTDPETVAWWRKQSKEARAAYQTAKAKTRSKRLEFALQVFSDWLLPIGRRNVRVWGCGAGFDQPILVAAYNACELPLPWEFWNEQCYRTLKTLYPSVKVEREGTHHNALDDAKHQARHALAIFAHMRRQAELARAAAPEAQ